MDIRFYDLVILITAMIDKRSSNAIYIIQEITSINYDFPSVT
jgi:hypothetical protein